MSKRAFRSAEPNKTDYPSQHVVDQQRRGFLLRVGLLLGGGALAACGGRPVEQNQGDAGVVESDAQPRFDAVNPIRPDSEPKPPPPPPPEHPENWAGGAKPMPAPADAGVESD